MSNNIKVDDMIQRLETTKNIIIIILENIVEVDIINYLKDTDVFSDDRVKETAKNLSEETRTILRNLINYCEELSYKVIR